MVNYGLKRPVYGDFFERDDTPLKGETGKPIVTSRAVADLLAFLERVQE